MSDSNSSASSASESESKSESSGSAQSSSEESKSRSRSSTRSSASVSSKDDKKDQKSSKSASSESESVSKSESESHSEEEKKDPKKETPRSQDPSKQTPKPPTKSDSASSASSASESGSDASHSGSSSGSSKSKSSRKSGSSESVSESESRSDSGSESTSSNTTESEAKPEDVTADFNDLSEEQYSPIKDYFTDLPEPAVVSQKPFETKDPYLQSINKSILQYREHVRSIQAEEEQLTKAFSEKLKTFNSEPSKARQEETERVQFLEKLDKIRRTRKHFRGLLYDAITQRNGVLESYETRKKMEKEKEEEFDKLDERKGIDWFLFSTLIWQAAILIAYIICFDYHSTLTTLELQNFGLPNNATDYYSSYTAIVWMVFLGFGFLRTYVKWNGFSSVGQTLFAGAYSIQFGILILGFFYYADVVKSGTKIFLTVPHLIEGVYCAFAVLISYGIWFGRIETPYLIVAVTIEILFYSLNHFIGLSKLNVVNPGMSIFVHVFGAFFGAAVSMVAGWDRKARGTVEEHSSYNSQKLSFLGFLFLWVMWPAFNGALAPNGTQLPAIVNTVLCQVVTTCTAYFFSHWFYGKFTPTELKLTGMAGGIAIGSAVGAVVPPYVPVVMGIFTGILVGLFPLFDKAWRFIGLRDTTHAFSLHGIVGVASSFYGMVATAAVKRERIQFGMPPREVFTEEYDNQGEHQLAALIITFGLALVGGITTAIVIRFVQKFRLRYFFDNKEWAVPEDFPAYITRAEGSTPGTETKA